MLKWQLPTYAFITCVQSVHWHCGEHNAIVRSACVSGDVQCVGKVHDGQVAMAPLPALTVH